MIDQFNKVVKRGIFVVVALFMLLTPLFFVHGDNKIDEDYLGINTTDQVSILKTSSGKILNSWMGSIVDNTGANNELALSIVRQAVLNDLKDYLLIEAPKEVVFEIAKTVGKLYGLFVAPDIKNVLSNIKDLTVKESVKYLMSWLGENNIKVGMGDLSDSYTDLTGKDSEANFQYVILYEPKTEEIGLVSIKIYSNKAINPPKSNGSWGSVWGTTWNYTKEH